MNQFENVCEGCPLRTKVDVDRASESNSWGSDGVQSQLSDGVNRYDVTLTGGEVCSSSVVRSIEQATQQRITECNGPEIGLLRQRCGAGLANALRWSKLVGDYTPNIANPEEIVPLLKKADYNDAMPYFSESALLVGSLRFFSDLDCPDHSAFTNFGIRKLAGTVRGTNAELRTGKAIMLDRVSWPVKDQNQRNIFRIRIAQGGPHFAFRSSMELNINKSKQEYDQDIGRILAEGIHAYLFSDTDALQQSKALVEAAENTARKRYKEIADLLAGSTQRKATSKTKSNKKKKS